MKRKKWLSAKEFGAQQAISDSLVRRYCRLGMIPKTACKREGTKWLIESEEARGWLKRNVGPRPESLG